MTVKALRVIPGGLAGMDAAGPSGLLEELYEKHAGAVYGRCRYVLRDDAEARDALQDVFVKVLKALPEFRAAASPSTWVLRIATHHCLNLIRARRAVWREQLQAVARDRRQETEPPDRRELVRVLLAAAPQEAQEVAVMYFVDELTQAEIAQELGRSLPTVRKRLREFLDCARAALKEALPGVTLPEGDDL
ncbi:MAG: RNA polymerase sigma factor [Myxococcales bacterium]|nr:sigma-70 family RNA polymerase sigma factor [Myxococcales bacterium]